MAIRLTLVDEVSVSAPSCLRSMFVGIPGVVKVNILVVNVFLDLR